MHRAGQTPSLPRMTKIGDMEHFVNFDVVANATTESNCS
jgi:hypothetical protein